MYINKDKIDNKMFTPSYQRGSKGNPLFNFKLYLIYSITI